MKKFLNVPRYYQSKGDGLCNLVCLEMVLDYYGSKVPRKRLVKELAKWYPPRSKRINSEGIAIYSAKKGFKVEFWQYDPGVINRRLYGKTETDKKIFQDVYRKLQDHKEAYEYYKSKIGLLIDCMEAGVKVHAKVPHIKLLTDAVDNKIACITGVKSAALNLDPTSGTNHSVVVVGYDNDNIWINDPGAKIIETKDPYPVPRDLFHAAWIMNGARTFIIRK